MIKYETELDETEVDYSPLGRQIHIAAIHDDWDSVSHIFQQDKKKLTVKISYSRWTALHIAVGTNRSHRFVKNIVEQIMTSDGGGVEALRIQNGPKKETALHMAARYGNVTAAKLLVSKDPGMPQIGDISGNTPLLHAAWNSDAETLHFLLSVTRDEVGESGISPFRGCQGADILANSIVAGHYDVAMYLVKEYPDLAWEKSTSGYTALKYFATKPDAFPSGTRLGFWQRIIYSMPYLKKFRDMKVRHRQAEQLVKQICSIVFKVDDSIIIDVVSLAITTAVSHGCHELIEECIRWHPGLLWYSTEDGSSVFRLSIKHRQEKVFNLIYQLSAYKMNTVRDVNNENALHVAAKLPAYHRLTAATGAALQMQRELLWFKEVEKFTEPTATEILNNDNKTPRMVFTEAHKQLLIDAQEWTKEISSSSTVVAALIVTMTFAAMFTIPGGNNDDGNPLLLQERIFFLFVMSDAVALFSSATSVLMFLSTLTRSSQDDFLHALPLRLALGLVSLFISLAATMVAFSATLVLVLRDRVQWIVVPVTLLASIPAVLFLGLQYPLLLELLSATFGKNIFHKQNDLLLH